MAASLLLTQATGAVVSPGADAATPGPFMDGVTLETQNWATFQTVFDPDNGEGNDQKFAFAVWASEQNNRYGFVCVDHDPVPAAQNNIYEAPAIAPNQVQMGVDGFQSAGKVFVSRPVSIDLMADSPSNDFFDTWFSAEEAASETFPANGQILLKSVGKKFTLVNGSLTSYTPLPPGGRVLGPRRYEITWERIIPASS